MPTPDEIAKNLDDDDSEAIKHLNIGHLSPHRHVIELDLQRGLRLWFDGEILDRNGYYTEDQSGNIHTLSTNSYVSKIEMPAYSDMPRVGASASVTIDHKKFDGYVTAVATDMPVTLYNNKTLYVDETHLYIKIEI
jgi:hypothetical protein